MRVSSSWGPHARRTPHWPAGAAAGAAAGATARAIGMRAAETEGLGAEGVAGAAGSAAMAAGDVTIAATTAGTEAAATVDTEASKGIAPGLDVRFDVWS